VIEAIHLVFGEQRQNELVERVRRGEAPAERLLHDDACPWPLIRIVDPRHQSTRRQQPYDRLEHARRHREVEEPVAFLLRAFGFDLVELPLDPLVRRGVGRVSADEKDPLLERLPHLLVYLLHLVRLGERGAHALTERLVVE